MDNLSLDVEFPIDNDRLKRESAEAKNIISGVGETAEVTAERAGKRMGDAFDKPIQKVGDLERNVASLKIQLQSYEAIVEKSFDSKVIADYNRRIEETKNQIAQLKTLGRDALVPMEQGAGKTKSNFNGLQNSINQMSRELPAFTYSAQTGFMGISNNIPILADEIGRLRQRNEELVASGQKGVPIWKQLVGGLFSWGTALSVGVMLLTVYGKEIGNFISSLFKGKAAIDGVKEAQKDLAEQMGKAGEASAKATIEIDLQKQAFEQARTGVITKAEALKLYNEKIGKTLGFTNDINVAEERTLKNGDAYIELMFKKAKAAALLSLYQEQISEQAKIDAKSNEDAGSFILSGTKGKSPALDKLYEKNAQLNRDKEKAPFVAKAEAFKKLILDTDNDIKEFSKKNGLSFEELTKPPKQKAEPKDQYDAVLKGREAIAKKINEAVASATGEIFTDEQKEINTIKKRYADFRDTIEEENKKIAAYNKTSKKKIDLLPVGDIDGAEANDLKAAAAARSEKDLQEALKASETFEQKKLAIAEKYQKLKNALLKLPADEYTKRAAVLEEQETAELNAAKETAYKKTEIYRRLGEEALVLTREQLRQQIEVMRSLMSDPALFGGARAAIEKELVYLENRLNLGAGKSNIAALNTEKQTVLENIGEREKLDIDTPEAEAELKKLYQRLIEIEGKVSELNAKGLKGFLASLKDNKTVEGIATGLGLASDAAMMMSEAMGGVDTEAGYTLDTIGKLAGAAADVGMAIVSGDPAKMVGAAIKAVGTLFSIGKKVKEMNAAARKEVADFYANAIAGEKVYQELLRARQIENVRANKTNLEGIRDEVKLRQEQIAAWDKDSKDIMDKLSGMSSIASESYEHGTWFRKAKVTKTYQSLEGKNFEELSQLLNQGKLEGDAKALVEELVKLEEKGYDAKKALADLAKQTSEIFTGTTSNALSDSLLNMFKEGRTGAQDLADFFKQTMDDAALSIFKNTVIAKEMDSFYKEFDERAQSGDELTEAEIAELDELFKESAERQKQKFEQLQRVTGSDLSKPGAANEGNNLSGAIKSITSEEAGIVAAQMGGQRLALLESNTIAKDGFASLKSCGENMVAMLRSSYHTQLQIEENTRRTADNTDKLAGVESSLKSIDKKMDSNAAAIKAGGV